MVRRPPALESLVVPVPRLGTAPTVAVPLELQRHFGAVSGDSRMWTTIVAELSRMGVRIRPTDPVSRRRFGRRAAVWLASGHAGAIQVDEPVVHHLHEAPWSETDDVHALDPAFQRAMGEASQSAADEATAVITPSEFSRRQIIAAHGVDPEVVHAVPHGVDPHTFHPGRAPTGRRLVDGAGWPGPYVVGVMSAHPRKNVPVLRDAMGLLAERGLPHGLVLVLSRALDRADSADLERDAEAPIPGLEGRLVVLRSLPEAELAGVVAAADALCLPSRSEGFGFAALEAMACGTPAVVSDRGSLPEVVGSAGLIVPPDPEAVAGGLETVLSDPSLRDRMSRMGVERSRAFTWEATATQWRKILEEAATR